MKKLPLNLYSLPLPIRKGVMLQKLFYCGRVKYKRNYLVKVISPLLTEGIPQMLWSGVEDNYNVMVIELLGPSIQDLFEYAGMKFPLGILLKIAKQMVKLFNNILDSKNTLCAYKEVHSS
jgi:hypothetical protein